MERGGISARSGGARSNPLRRLAAQLGEEAQLEAPLATFSAVGIGGKADLLVVARRRETLVRVLREARSLGIPLRFFGGLTNVLLPDEGVRGIVVLNRMRGYRLHWGQLLVEGGTVIAPLARRLVKYGLGGLEWAVSLPGTMGGAIVGNAGAYGGEIGAILEEAELLSPQGEVVCVGAEWFGFDYRTSRLKESEEPWVILSAKLRLHPEELAALQVAMQRNLEHRRRTQPSGRSLGSTFRNPPGDYAGRLIDAAGLKGLRRGGIVVSEKHANFFINEGGGTAADYLALMREVQERVMERFGVWLEPEIEIVGAATEVAARRR